MLARRASGCAERKAANEDVFSAWGVFPSLDVLLASTIARRADVVLVDVPIGLGDGPPRACDREARARLGARRSSVFPPPMRGMLCAASQAEASAFGRARRIGGGVSAQSWNIMPKIREAEAMMTPALQDRVREGHPEVAFARMAGAPMTEGKRTPGGAARRRAVLDERAEGLSALMGALRAEHPRRVVSDDDVLDAAALALSGLDVLDDRAWRLGDGATDARGLRMEIWG